MHECLNRIAVPEHSSDDLNDMIMSNQEENNYENAGTCECQVRIYDQQQ